MKPLGGKICWHGRPANEKQRLHNSFLVMQDVNYQLFSDSVREEILLGAAHPERCDEVMQALGLAGLAALLIATIVTTKTYHKNEKKLREDIWREYK